MTCFVTDPPPVIVPPQNVSVLPGDTAVLTCVAFSTVHYNMTWARMGSYGNLRLDPRMRWYNNGSLVIRQGAASVRFSYVCVCERECVAEGKCLPVIHHYSLCMFNIYILSFGAGRLISCEHFCFVCRNVQPYDEGIYQCRASNEGGSTTQSVGLRLQGEYLPPAFPVVKGLLFSCCQTININ